MSAALEWLLRSSALAAAAEQLANEPSEARARREQCRALFDAAATLRDASPGALAALHARGLQLANAPPAAPGALRDAHAAALARLEAPRTAQRTAWRDRSVRLTALVVLIALAVTAGYSKARRALDGPNLLAGAEWKTSSSLLTCLPADHLCGGLVTDIFFHTRFEKEPWVQYDLGAERSFSKLRVKNRQDMGPDRAVPLIAETSADAEHWQPVARREQTFSEWTASFTPVHARYLRLRADRTTWLHLEAVELFE